MGRFEVGLTHDNLHDARSIRGSQPYCSVSQNRHGLDEI
jgi:hypothetical protein